jgi:hypothetical protein
VDASPLPMSWKLETSEESSTERGKWDLIHQQQGFNDRIDQLFYFRCLKPKYYSSFKFTLINSNFQNQKEHSLQYFDIIGQTSSISSLERMFLELNLH